MTWECETFVAFTQSGNANLRATGNVHTAVSPEFVLEVDDILYFTGMIDTFGDFCEEHGLEVLTNEVELEMTRSDSELKDELGIQVRLPWDDDLCHLAKRWYGLRPDEKVVGQINSD